jgi:hypothetical protein
LGLSQAPEAAELEVWRDGSIFHLQATAALAVDPRVAWDTLTDHEHLSDFIDEIERSRVVSRDANRWIVEHLGTQQILFFTLPIRVRLAVTHEPFERVHARSAPGTIDGAAPTLRSFEGSYTLTVVSVQRRAGVRIDYRAQFELAERLPPLIDPLFGRALVAHLARRHFDAMLREIERRQARRAAQR